MLLFNVVPRWRANVSRRGLETLSRDLLAHDDLSPADVAILSRGQMHTDQVAQAIYDKRDSRANKVNAILVYKQKILPALRSKFSN